MKKENLEKRKFNFEKFEVAKLSNMKSINGGDGGGGNDNTITLTDGAKVSSRLCKVLSGGVN